VDAVNTLNPGDPATVNTSFDGSNVRFTFGIPRGSDGIQGPQGDPGAQGSQGMQGDVGPQGLPGEVSNAVLAEAIANALTEAADSSSSNSDAVALLGLTVSDPPTQAEVQSVANKLDELIAALRR
jgi:hypothetical protein